MAARFEGTFCVDGILEGPLPSIPEARERLNGWIALSRERHTPFTLEVRGEAFSVHAPGAYVPLPPGLQSLPEHLAETLDRLVKIFPAEQRSHLLSTVRLTQIRPGLERQTVYAVTPRGELELMERELPTQTLPPILPFTRAEKIKLGLIATVVCLVALLISSFFVDYKKMVLGLFGHDRRFDPAHFTIDPGPFAPYVKVSPVTSGGKGREVVFTLVRTPAYPDTTSRFNALLGAIGRLPSPAEATLRRLTLEALLRGYITMEIFTADGRFLTAQMVRVAPLGTKPSLAVSILLPAGVTAGAIRFTP